MPTPTKPSVIKALEGNRSKFGSKQIRQDPKGIGKAEAPRHLKPEEMKLFKAVIASLPITLLSAADNSVLERMAVAWARFRKANREVHRLGELVQSPQGPVINPYFKIMDRCTREMHKAGGELGLSPAARARLAAVGMAEDDPMSILLGSDLDPTGAWSTPPRNMAN